MTENTVMATKTAMSSAAPSMGALNTDLNITSANAITIRAKSATHAIATGIFVIVPQIIFFISKFFFLLCGRVRKVG